jgi:HAD superfamily hydrolase (TIGR01549 family)
LKWKWLSYSYFRESFTLADIYSNREYARITTVIFDMDGTLIKHTWQLRQITEAFFARFAEQLAPVTHDQFFDCFWPKNEDLWYMMVDGVIDGDTAARYSYINTLRVLRKDTALAEAMAHRWNELVLAEAIPFEDTVTVLKAVRQKYTVGILTNGFTTLQRGKIKRHQLDEYVDFTLVSEEAGYHKPDKRLFWAALKLAGDVLPEQTLYVGDNFAADIQGAQGAGLTPIFMCHDDGVSAPGVVKIRQLSELLSLLKL